MNLDRKMSQCDYVICRMVVGLDQYYLAPYPEILELSLDITDLGCSFREVIEQCDVISACPSAHEEKVMMVSGGIVLWERDGNRPL